MISTSYLKKQISDDWQLERGLLLNTPYGDEHSSSNVQTSTTVRWLVLPVTEVSGFVFRHNVKYLLTKNTDRFDHTPLRSAVTSLHRRFLRLRCQLLVFCHRDLSLPSKANLPGVPRCPISRSGKEQED